MSNATTILHHPRWTLAGPRFLSDKKALAPWRAVTARVSHASPQVALLRGIPLFAECSDAQLRQIASLATEHAVKAGQVLMEQDELGFEFFVIVEGWAAVTRNGVRLAGRGPGSFLGELALMDRGTRTATVVAESDMRLLVLSPREFDSLHRVAPCVAYRMLRELAARLRQSDEMNDRRSDQRVGVAL